jgi:hypothetical protein
MSGQAFPHSQRFGDLFVVTNVLVFQFFFILYDKPALVTGGILSMHLGDLSF